MRFALPVLCLFASAAPAHAEWRAATPEVAEAVRDARIAAVLRAVDAIDRAATTDDHLGFAARLAPELAVNSPGNVVNRRDEVVRRNAEGRIAYSRYDRVIEYAGVRDGMVVLMGTEIVAPKGGPQAGREVRRRFTDLWREEGGRWLLTARQATIVAAP